jgi:hypothetical protein
MISFYFFLFPNSRIDILIKQYFKIKKVKMNRLFINGVDAIDENSSEDNL